MEGYSELHSSQHKVGLKWIGDLGGCLACSRKGDILNKHFNSIIGHLFYGGYYIKGMNSKLLNIYLVKQSINIF